MAEQPDIETMRIIAPDAGELERAAEAALRPKKLSEFVGQRVVRGQLQLVLDAARMRASTPDHVLLAGPPGLGKTTLAMIIAAEMGTSLRLTSGPAIQHAGDLAAILSGLQEGDILFIDEIHRLARTAEEMLYLAMRGVPRERDAISWAARASMGEPRRLAERVTTDWSSSVS